MIQVGKAMSSNESAAYEIMRSLDVDYVLIIFGGVIGYSGDDINKFLWMVRIAEGEHPKDIRVSGNIHRKTEAFLAEYCISVCSSLLFFLNFYLRCCFSGSVYYSGGKFLLIIAILFEKCVMGCFPRTVGVPEACSPVSFNIHGFERSVTSKAFHFFCRILKVQDVFCNSCVCVSLCTIILQKRSVQTV